MARNIDDNKIERIREATMKMVVAKGFGNASISEIARSAGVAEGYLYRFYKSKTELVESLLYTNLNELMDKLEFLLDNRCSFEDLLEQLVRTLFTMAKESPDKIKFLYVMMNDYNFTIREEQRKRIFNLCSRVKSLGNEKGLIHPELTEEEIYLLGVAYPIQFINLRLKSFFDQSDLTETEMNRVFRICEKSFKK